LGQNGPGTLELFDFLPAMAITESAPPRVRFTARLTTLLHAITRRLSSRPRFVIAAFGIFFAAAIMAVFLADLRARYHSEITLAEHTARNFADILAEHTVLTFAAADRALHQATLIRVDLQAALTLPGADEAALRRRAGEALVQLQRSSLVLMAIGWTNAGGDLEVRSDANQPERTNIAGLPHFTAHRNAEADKLYVSPAFRAAGRDRWFIAVSRRLANPDGSFAGVVAAVLDQSYFLSLYRSLDVGPRGAVIMLKRDDGVLARQPPLVVNEASIGHRPVTTQLQTAEAGAYQAVSVVDQTPRIIGYKAVPVPPVVVLVSYHRDDRLEGWYQHLYTFGPGALAVVVLILLGTAALTWQAGNLAKKNRILEVTLENMAHGLCMFDAGQRLIVCNERYAKMYGLSADQMRPGTTLRQILEARVAAGSSPEAAQEYIETRIDEVTRNEPYCAVNELRNGRFVAVTHQPIEGGGWVAIHQDITDSRRDEEKVAYMARHDLLTGLANRTNFMEKLEEAGARMRRRNETFTVLCWTSIASRTSMIRSATPPATRS
jgi:PAS domain S-box-containing protein